MGAETFAPPTSVDRGTAFVPAAIVSGSPLGLADHLASEHVAPGEAHVTLLDFGSTPLPGAARYKGRLVRFTVDGDERLALSDGTNWHSLVSGGAL